jgi:hypothetical protein
VDQQGAEQIVKSLDRLVSQHGERFEPADRLRTHASQATTFHD